MIQPTLSKELTHSDNLQIRYLHEDDASELSISESLVGLTTKNVSLSNSLVTKTDFSTAVMFGFDIHNCQIVGSNFTGSKFEESNWRTVHISDSRCSGLQVQNSMFKNVTFAGSKLDLVNFRFVKMENVIFDNCILDDADFYGATLKNIDFVNCRITKINFGAAKIKNVDLSESTIEELQGVNSIRGITISYDQLIQLAPYFAAEAGIKIK